MSSKKRITGRSFSNSVNPVSLSSNYACQMSSSYFTRSPLVSIYVTSVNICHQSVTACQFPMALITLPINGRVNPYDVFIIILEPDHCKYHAAIKEARLYTHKPDRHPMSIFRENSFRKYPEIPQEMSR